VYDTCRLPQRRSTTVAGSRLPIAPLSSKYVTSGTTRDTTVTTTTNNNNSPPGESPAHHGTPGLDASRDSGDVTVDQSAQARRSPAGKRPRKAMSAGGRVARPVVPGPAEPVDSAGQPRRVPPIAGKLSVSATNSPLNVTALSGNTSSGSGSSRKQTSFSTTSASLTDVATKSDPARASPELGRRKATTSSRLAVCRASGRPPKVARPASDGSGTATGSGSYRALGCKLPSLVTGSVGAISDSGVKTVTLTSFQPTTGKQLQQQQQSSRSDHRPAASTSSSSSGPCVQFGTQRVVGTDLPSPITSGASPATHLTADDTESLPDRQGDLHSFPDKPRDRQSQPDNERERPDISDWQTNSLSCVDNKKYHLSTVDWQGDNQNVLEDQADDKTILCDQEHQQNIIDDQQSFTDRHEFLHVLIDGQGQGNYPGFLVARENGNITTEGQKHQDAEYKTVRTDPKTVPVGQWSPGRQCIQSNSVNNHQLIVSEFSEVSDTAAAANRRVGETTSCDDDDVNDVTSCEPSDVILPPSTTPASSVVMTTDATGSANPTTVTGK